MRSDLKGFTLRRTSVRDEKGDDLGNVFSSHWEWFKQDPEANSGKSIVDPSGYIPAKDRIENLLRAGETLDAYRRELYHYGADDDDDGFLDPTLSPGFDPADATRINREAIDNLRTRQEASSNKQDVEAKSEANKAEPSVNKDDASALAFEASVGSQEDVKK